MMELVLQDCEEFSTAYLDDVLIGFQGNTVEQFVVTHARHVRAVLEVFEKWQLVCHPKKHYLFHMEVESCGHILRDGTRRPAPGKLAPIQGWLLPATVTGLRSFLRLANYFSEYVKGYAYFSAALTEFLKVGKEDGQKGSKKPVFWDEEGKAAFLALKG